MLSAEYILIQIKVHRGVLSKYIQILGISHDRGVLTDGDSEDL